LLRKNGVKKIVVAVPVLPLDKVDSMGEIADDLVYVFALKFFPGVGMFYEDFNQVSDSDAKKMLKEINKEQQIEH
jgi:putative phosphoribosyl transferase